MLTFSTNSVWSTAVCGRARTKGYWRSAVLLGGVLAGGMTIGQAWAAGDDPRSTSIALNRGGTLLFVANREADSLTVFAVGTPGPNVLTKLAEVPVGEEPVCVASDGLRAFVVNAVSGTVSVVELIGRRRVREDRGHPCRHGAARLRAQRHASLRDQLHRGHSLGHRHQ